MSRRAIIRKHQLMYKPMFKYGIRVNRIDDVYLERSFGLTNFHILAFIDYGYCLSSTQRYGYKVPKFIYSHTRKSKMHHVYVGMKSTTIASLEHKMGRSLGCEMFKETKAWFIV